MRSSRRRRLRRGLIIEVSLVQVGCGQVSQWIEKCALGAWRSSLGAGRGLLPEFSVLREVLARVADGPWVSKDSRGRRAVSPVRAGEPHWPAILGECDAPLQHSDGSAQQRRPMRTCSAPCPRPCDSRLQRAAFFASSAPRQRKRSRYLTLLDGMSNDAANRRERKTSGSPYLSSRRREDLWIGESF